MEQLKHKLEDVKNTISEALPAETSKKEAIRIYKSFLQEDNNIKNQAVSTPTMLLFISGILAIIAAYFFLHSIGLLEISPKWYSRINYINGAIFVIVLLIGIGLISEEPSNYYRKMINSLERKLQNRVKELRKKKKLKKQSPETTIEEISKFVIEKLSNKFEKKMTKIQKRIEEKLTNL
ncbi:MAG: hypothetical protein NZ108_01700 [Bacteroidia bacterium]|nr:hypothetical protein [Bacteroidia bacterium]